MANPNDINIDIKTTANTGGADQAEEAIKDVSTATKDTVKAQDELDQSNVRIIDTTRKKTESIEEQTRAFNELQAARDRARAAGSRSSGLASNVITDEDRADQSDSAARLQRAREINDAAAAEAAANRKIAESVKANQTAKENLEKQQRETDQARDVRTIKRLAFARAMSVAGQATRAAAASIREFGKELDGIDDETAGQIESVAGGLDLVSQSAQGAAAGMAVLGPPGAVIGAVVAPALGKLKDEAEGAFRAFANLKAAEQIFIGLPERFEAVRQALRVKEQGEQWAALRVEIEQSILAAESLSRIAAAERDVREFSAAQDVRLARATGGDVEAAEARLQQVREENLAERQAEEFRRAQDDLLRAQQDYAISQGLAARDAEKNSEEQNKMAADVAKYRAALAAAERNLTETSQLLALEREKFGTGTRTENVVKAAGREEAAQGTSVEAINELLESLPPTASGNLRAAADLLRQYTENNALSADELERIPTILERFTNEVNALGQAQADALRTAISEVEILKREMQTLKLSTSNGIR